MTPYYHDEWLTILQGDVREVLPTLASDSVDCIVTSPPYLGLRDYGTASWSGGDAACDHKPETRSFRDGCAGCGGPMEAVTPQCEQCANRASHRRHRGTPDRTYGEPVQSKSKDYDRDGRVGYPRTSTECGKCGATRSDGQIGLERTPAEYVANMVGVFRELRRVLKPSGTCWLNLGDSYAGSGKGGNPEGSAWSGFVGNGDRENAAKASPPYTGLAQKQLVGIPWRVAFALQADGWYLRSDIIWSKPNPMPESVTDRPTKSHEYLFMLTRSPRYYFDSEAVREDAISAGQVRGGGQKASTNGIHGGRTDGQNLDRLGQLPTATGRNLRSVWTIATRPYPGAHFAVFPPELPERCIKAGSSERGVCPECGAPWERVVERTPALKESPAPLSVKIEATQGRSIRRGPGTTMSNSPSQRVAASGETTGWRPTCRHETLKPTPAVICDPFAGSGTTGMVANRLSRRAILIDLNGDYLKQQLQRNAQTPLGLGAA